MVQISISCIVAAFNCKNTIVDCIESLIKQDLNDIKHEIIVVNDGSTDGTKETLDSLDYANLRVIHLERNLGVSNARNTAVEASRGKYLAILDADDIAMDGRLIKQFTFLEENPKVGILGSQIKIVSDWRSRALLRHTNAVMPLHDLEIRKIVSWRLPFHQPSTMIRKTAFLKAGGYDTKYRLCEDCIIFAKILKYYQGANMPEPLTLKREGRTTLSNEGSLVAIFWLNLKSRLFAVYTLNLSPWHYLRAIASSIIGSTLFIYGKYRSYPHTLYSWLVKHGR